MEENEYSKGEIALGAIFLIWFFGSILAAATVAKIGGMLVLAVFGQIFFVFGIMALVSGLREKNFKPIFTIVIFIGIAMMLYGIILSFADTQTVRFFQYIFPYVAFGMVLLVGILCLLNIAVRKSAEKHCTELVRARCVDIKMKRKLVSSGAEHRRRRYMYCPVFAYTYNDKDYTGCNYTYSTGVTAQIGEEYFVYINPARPTHFFEKNENGRITANEFTVGIFAVVFGIFGIGIVTAIKLGLFH